MKICFNIEKRIYKERVFKELSKTDVANMLGVKVLDCSIVAFGISTIEYSVFADHHRYILIDFNPLKRDQENYYLLLEEFKKYHKNFTIHDEHCIDLIEVTGYCSISELSENGKLSLEQAESFMDEVIKIHKNGFLHLGITPYNDFFNENNCMLINNDSLVCKDNLENKNLKYISSNPFSAPEIKMKSGENIMEQSDVYSVVILLKHFFDIDAKQLDVICKGQSLNIMKRYMNVQDLKSAFAEAV